MAIRIRNLKKIYAADFYVFMEGLKRITILGYPHIIYWKKDDITYIAYNKLNKTLYFNSAKLIAINKVIPDYDYNKYHFASVLKINIKAIANPIPLNFEYKLPTSYN